MISSQLKPSGCNLRNVISAEPPFFLLSSVGLSSPSIDHPVNPSSHNFNQIPAQCCTSDLCNDCMATATLYLSNRLSVSCHAMPSSNWYLIPLRTHSCGDRQTKQNKAEERLNSKHLETFPACLEPVWFMSAMVGSTGIEANSGSFCLPGNSYARACVRAHAHAAQISTIVFAEWHDYIVHSQHGSSDFLSSDPCFWASLADGRS